MPYNRKSLLKRLAGVLAAPVVAKLPAQVVTPLEATRSSTLAVAGRNFTNGYSTITTNPWPIVTTTLVGDCFTTASNTIWSTGGGSNTKTWANWRGPDSDAGMVVA